MTQHYHDPLANQIHDFQELSLTYAQISLEKTRTQHRLPTHYFPLHFPEIERYYHASRSEWLLAFLQVFPTPALIARLSMEDFVQQAWAVVGRKVSKERLLEDIHHTAQCSIGIPVDEDSEAVAMFRVVLGEMVRLCQVRDQLEERAAHRLKDNADSRRLQQLPGVSPILALTILAEAGDLRRFNHHRQFLKFCGFDLSTQQSGQFRGTTKLSKYGNARPRCAFWMAATVPVRLSENSFRDKFERYLRRDPLTRIQWPSGSRCATKSMLHFWFGRAAWPLGATRFAARALQNSKFAPLCSFNYCRRLRSASTGRLRDSR